ncbi:MAG: hypothetical protein M1114_02185 [Candidatus Dependentiae bacterium]|nr:hypothetical protein [Candidatus Dependentiae bacterium]
MNITNTQKGIILIIVGILVLLNTLHALGWGINIILIAGSVAAIAWGFILANGPHYALKTFNTLFKKKQQK